MERVPKLKPADLLLVGGDWWVSKLIGYFTQYRGEVPTKIHHVAGMISYWHAGMISHNQVEEALLKVEKSPFSQWDASHNYYQIWRNTYLTEEQRVNIALQVKSYTNNLYGGWKLWFHMMDGILGKIFGKDIFIFRNFLSVKKYPICSWLWSYAYYDVMLYEFGKPANIVSPDDMHDNMKRSEQWKLLYEKWS